MEIEKLIEDLRWWEGHCDRTNFGCQTGKVLEEAATALSTLQAENARLRAELEQKTKAAQQYQEEWYKAVAKEWYKAVATCADLRAEAEKAQGALERMIALCKGKCLCCTRRYECNTKQGPHKNCWEFDGMLLREDCDGQ